MLSLYSAFVGEDSVARKLAANETPLSYPHSGYRICMAEDFVSGLTTIRSLEEGTSSDLLNQGLLTSSLERMRRIYGRS